MRNSSALRQSLRSLPNKMAQLLRRTHLQRSRHFVGHRVEPQPPRAGDRRLIGNRPLQYIAPRPKRPPGGALGQRPAVRDRHLAHIRAHRQHLRHRKAGLPKILHPRLIHGPARVQDDAPSVAASPRAVLDILAHHPSTAKFIATKLVRHFVSDDPPPALVDRVAQTFMKRDGDIREMLKTIFSSAEFNSTNAYRAKIKRPFELAVSAVRTTGADTNGGPQLHQWIARMGQPLYGFQTPNGYSDVAENWVNTGALLERMNFALALVSNRIPGTRVDLSRFISANSEKQAIDKNEVLDRFIAVIVGGEISAQTRETLLKQLGDEMTLPPSPPATQIASNNAPANPFETGFQMGVGFTVPGQQQGPPRQQQLAAVAPAAFNNPVVRMVGLILGSPEFQRQ